MSQASNLPVAYARALTELSQTEGVQIESELLKFHQCINNSNELENVLFLDVFTVSEKLGVIEDLVRVLKLSPFTSRFLSFLAAERRLPLFPQIFTQITIQKDAETGFLKGRIEGPDDTISAEMKDVYKSYLEKKLNKKVELHYHKNTNITAGHIMRVEDLLLDASVDLQWKKLGESILTELSFQE